MLHKRQFPPHPDTAAYRTFMERIARTNYERRWRHTYKGPGFKAHLLAILIFIVPKIGAASDLAIKIPNALTQEWYVHSVNHTVDHFRELLQQLQADPGPQLKLANLDLDTGERVRLGDYALADKAYKELLERIISKPRRTVSADLRRDVVEYFEGPVSITEATDPIPDELATLKSMRVKGSRESE